MIIINTIEEFSSLVLNIPVDEEKQHEVILTADVIYGTVVIRQAFYTLWKGTQRSVTLKAFGVCLEGSYEDLEDSYEIEGYTCLLLTDGFLHRIGIGRQERGHKRISCRIPERDRIRLVIRP